MLSVQTLSKKFQDKLVLDEISFELHEGEILSLIGPSGSGKSTLIGILTGLRRADGGKVLLAGEPFPGLAHRQKVGFVPQEDLFDEEFTCGENLLMYGRFFSHLSKKLILRRTKDLMSLFHLEEYWSAPLSNLSGGMRRRLSLVRALLSEPSFLILDEFSTGLDPHTKKELHAFLKEVITPKRMMLIVSHDMDEVLSLSHRVLLLSRGQLRASGPPQEVLKNSLANFLIQTPKIPHLKSFLQKEASYFREVGFDYQISCTDEEKECILRKLKNFDRPFFTRPIEFCDLFTFYY